MQVRGPPWRLFEVYLCQQSVGESFRRHSGSHHRMFATSALLCERDDWLSTRNKYQWKHNMLDWGSNDTTMCPIYAYLNESMSSNRQGYLAKCYSYNKVYLLNNLLQKLIFLQTMLKDKSDSMINSVTSDFPYPQPISHIGSCVRCHPKSSVASDWLIMWHAILIPFLMGEGLNWELCDFTIF